MAATPRRPTDPRRERPPPTISAMRSGISVEDMDREVRPQDDLFGYVNGGWVARTQIPSDRALHGTFRILADDAEQHLRAIVEEAAASDAAPGTPARKVGDLYAAFLDEARIRELGLDPVRDDLDRALAVQDPSDLLRQLGSLQRRGVRGAVELYVMTDKRDSTRYLPYLEQSGIGLPDESYYREDSFAGIRQEYAAHIGRMLDLAGIDADAAPERILALETRLASAHWDRVRSRDAVATYTLLDRTALQELTPGLDWTAWLEGVGAPASVLDEVVARQPDFLAALAQALDAVPIGDWGLWLAWRVLSGSAPYLSDDVADESFAFYGRTLTGAPEQKERWKRGIDTVESALGEAVGQLYVERHFPPEAKERMTTLVANLVEAYRRNIEQLDWMSAETKVRAQDKLSRFIPKIGYPDQWRDYSALQVDPEDLLGSVRAGAAFETDRELAKLGGPVDRTEWHMTPQTVNAYYNPGMNEIVFPAGILQPPFFDLEAEDSVNYGAIGAVIGHEIGHGFDDQGSRYDGLGNLSDWWTEQDRERFDALTQALIAQYDAFEPRDLPGRHVNGALTVGENIGDLGGVTIAYQAWRIANEGNEDQVLDGLTGAQRLFAGWATCWRTKAREEEAVRRLSVDPHSPPEFRANVVRNLEEFYDAFDVKEGDELWLAPEERVRIW
jgi:putative endopeptidase